MCKMRPALLFLLVASSSLVYAQQPYRWASSTLVYAQQSYRCNSPLQWTGDIVYVDATDEILGLGNFSYDATNQRQRVIEHVTSITQNVSVMYELIQLYKENVSYAITEVGGKSTCKKQTLNTPFNPVGVPESFKHLATLCAGLVLDNGDCQGLLVDSWQGTIKDPDGVHNFVGTFTRDGLPDTVCLPVAILDSFTNSTSGMTQNAHVSYFNITASVDPSVFIPPKECM